MKNHRYINYYKNFTSEANITAILELLRDVVVSSFISCIYLRKMIILVQAQLLTSKVCNVQLIKTARVCLHTSWVYIYVYVLKELQYIKDLCGEINMHQTKLLLKTTTAISTLLRHN